MLASALALLSGNAFAGERADRSAEFIDYLPLERWRRVVSKLLLHLVAFVVLIGANLVALGQILELDNIANVLGVALMLYGVNWFASSIQSSPVVATMSGVVLLLFFGTLGIYSTETTEPPRWLFAVVSHLRAIGGILSLACFSMGTGYYLLSLRRT